MKIKIVTSGKEYKGTTKQIARQLQIEAGQDSISLSSFLIKEAQRLSIQIPTKREMDKIEKDIGVKFIARATMRAEALIKGLIATMVQRGSTSDHLATLAVTNRASRSPLSLLGPGHAVRVAEKRKIAIENRRLRAKGLSLEQVGKIRKLEQERGIRMVKEVVLTAQLRMAERLREASVVQAVREAVPQSVVIRPRRRSRMDGPITRQEEMDQRVRDAGYEIVEHGEI